MIRLATPADVPSIIHLERACVSAAHWTEQQYKQALEDGGANRLVLIANLVAGAPPHSVPHNSVPHNSVPHSAIPCVDPSILGFLVALHLAPEWELENVVVAPSSRRQGLGERLLEALVTKARETNSSGVFLEVRESNVAARGLYEKTEFEQAGRRKLYYKDPAEDAVLYRLTLK